MAYIQSHRGKFLF